MSTLDFLMPSAKRLVALNNLDASAIVGTGLGGRIMGYDVQNYLDNLKKPAKRATPPPAKPTVAGKSFGAMIIAGPNYVDEPVETSQKAQLDISQMIKKQIPHSYVNGSTNVTNLLSFIHSISSTSGVTLSVVDVAVKAITNSLIREGQKTVNVNVCLETGYNTSSRFTLPSGR